MIGNDMKEAVVARFEVHGDSKLLSGDPWRINGNLDNNLESPCIISEFGCRNCGQLRETSFRINKI
jgi:hypothetical protein